MFRQVLFILLAVVFALSCTKDRDLDRNQYPNVSLPPDAIEPGLLLINEFLTSGENYLNEFGVPSDWIEVYNPNIFNVILDGKNWYITDDALANELKYRLPSVTIPAKGFLLIWADNSHKEPNASDIHANFALSPEGEAVGIFYEFDGKVVRVDEHIYSLQEVNKSEGRVSDGANAWVIFDSPTPGKPNL